MHVLNRIPYLFHPKERCGYSFCCLLVQLHEFYLFKVGWRKGRLSSLYTSTEPKLIYDHKKAHYTFH